MEAIVLDRYNSMNSEIALKAINVKTGKNGCRKNGFRIPEVQDEVIISGKHIM